MGHQFREQTECVGKEVANRSKPKPKNAVNLTNIGRYFK